MNKEEFISRLESSLDIFEDNIKKEEVEKYSGVIEERQKNGETEEEIIKSFGTISEVQEKILKSHGINPQKLSKKNGFIYKQFEELFQVIHHVIDEMEKNDFQSNLKIIVDILILIAFICLIKIPFILVRNLGDSLIINLNITFMSGIWGLIVDIIYIVVAIIVFVNIFNKYFKNIKGNKKTNLKQRGKELESINLEKK